MMAHGYCYLWRPELVALHVGSDSVIGISYLVISGCLAYLVYRAREIAPFGWMVGAFGAFIVACGVTHLLGVWAVWDPIYWTSGWAKLLTALVSVATAIALPPLVPRALDLLRADQRTAEARVREESAMRLALFGGPLADWEADRTWVEALTSLMGCTEDDLDRSLDAFLVRVHEEDRPRVRGVIEDAREAMGTYEVEFRVLPPHGGLRWLETRGRFWRSEPARTGRLSSVFWDVTRRKLDEERLRIAERTLQATANGVVVSDATRTDLPIVLVNEAFTDITGYPAEEVRGRNCRFLNDGVRQQPALDEVRSAIREARDCRVNLVNRRRDGTWFWNDLTISPVWDDTDTIVTHFVGVQRDVSSQVALASERETLLARAMVDRAEAERANRAKDDFLALLSHELRTPLQASVTWLQLAERETDVSPQIERILGALRRSTSHVTRLVEDLLDSSRVVAGRLSMEKQPLHVAEPLESTVNALEPLAAQRGVLLRVGDRAPTAVVEGDAQRLSQALRALLDNAIKYSPAGRDVVVSYREVGEEVEIVVRDQGQGIRADAIPHLFERFSQADVSRSRRHGGLGLGLFLVHSIVELHGGSVEAESAGPGQGATFRIRLPRLAGTTTPAPAVRKPPRGVRSLEGIHILLVEDDELAAEAFTELLAGLGARVRVAGTAQEARSRLEDESFDLILSDIGLPDEDGVSFLSTLRAAEERDGRRRIAAVAMSGYTGAGEVAEMLSAGFDAHVAKPIGDFAALQDLLISLLDDAEDE